jgi:hypothetical protein
VHARNYDQAINIKEYNLGGNEIATFVPALPSAGVRRRYSRATIAACTAAPPAIIPGKSGRGRL